MCYSKPDVVPAQGQRALNNRGNPRLFSVTRGSEHFLLGKIKGEIAENEIGTGTFYGT